jgi:nicotinate-nucleotide pyrophosphorylase (carboxylating)
MERDFPQVTWDAAVAEECRRLVRLAIAEDLGDQHDWTTLALVPSGASGRAAVVSRQAGVVCGLRAAAIVLHEMDLAAEWLPQASDGQAIEPGQSVGEMAGSARTLLAAERTLLNALSSRPPARTPASTTPARPRPAGGGSKSTPWPAAADTTTAWACATRS